MKKCKSCQTEIDKKAIKCPHCQTDQRNWFKRHPILTVIIVIFVIALIGGSKGGSNVKPEPSPEVTRSAEKFNVVVTSQIVKKVDGKYRYFFDIRNNDTKDFEGKVIITVYNSLGNEIWSNPFESESPIKPKLGDSVYFDINSGPTKINGESGISKFKYQVLKDNLIVNEGEGLISDKYEDLY